MFLPSSRNNIKYRHIHQDTQGNKIWHWVFATALHKIFVGERHASKVDKLADQRLSERTMAA